MEVGTTYRAADRAAWRAWLELHHADTVEVWLIFDDRPEQPAPSYLDAVEEAICFGWIDSLQKRISEHERAQRFSPRRRGSSWTELNKERARRLIRLGLMTEAGRATLPDLELPPIEPAADIVAALKAEPGAWAHFEAFPELYQRIRLGNIEAVRKDPAAFERRLRTLVSHTAQGRMYGDWNDGGRLG